MDSCGELLWRSKHGGVNEGLSIGMRAAENGRVILTGDEIDST